MSKLVSAMRGRAWMIRAGIVFALFLAGCTFFWRTTRSNDVAFLNSFDGAEWIVFPTAYFGGARPAVAFDTRFQRSIHLGAKPRAASLRCRALRDGWIEINGQRVLMAFDASDWRREVAIDVTDLLQTGENIIIATVENPTGPAALWLDVTVDQASVLRTDSEWQASLAGSSWRHANIARDRHRPDPGAAAVASFKPIVSLQTNWPWLLLFTVIAIVTVIAVDRYPLPTRIAISALALFIVGWAILFLHNSRWLLATVGFDAAGHQDYIRFIAQRWALPLPSDGWTMYHPPLYYLSNAVVLKATDAVLGGPSIIHVIRTLNLLFGAATLWLVFASLRLLFPDRSKHWLLGLTIVAFLPANLYLHQYPTNEVLAATTVSAATFLALRIIIRRETNWSCHLALGATLGAAMLTKVSALIPAAIILVTLGIMAGRSRRAMTQLVCALIIAVLICGWHYARIWQHFGKPFVSNWEPETGFQWWQDPGFHTSADYFQMGQFLVQPIFNLGLSVPDSLYATLFGDAQLGGPLTAEHRPPWAYELMSAGYLLAIVPMVCVIVGLIVAIVRFVQRIDPAWTMLTAILIGVATAIVLLTLQVPHFGSAKGFYGLIALIPFAAVASLGVDALSCGNRRLYATIATLILLFALNSYATYWIRTDDAQVRTLVAKRLLVTRDQERAQEMLRSATQIDPSNADTRLTLAQHYIDTRRFADARKWLDLAPGERDDAGRHLLLAQLESFAGQTQLAGREIDRAIELDPVSIDAHMMRGSLAMSAGDCQTAIDANRDALALNPYIDVVHQSLAECYDKLGDSVNARRHRRYLEILKSLARAEKKRAS